HVSVGSLRLATAPAQHRGTGQHEENDRSTSCLGRNSLHFKFPLNSERRGPAHTPCLPSPAAETAISRLPRSPWLRMKSHKSKSGELHGHATRFASDG